MAEKGLIITGARARFSIEGVKVGFATDVNLGEEIQYEEANVLDNIEVEEYVPVGYRVTFTARKFRIVGETLKSRAPKIETPGDASARRCQGGTEMLAENQGAAKPGET